MNMDKHRMNLEIDRLTDRAVMILSGPAILELIPRMADLNINQASEQQRADRLAKAAIQLAYLTRIRAEEALKA